MWKYFSLLLCAPLILGGCVSARFTNLTVQHQTRNSNNLYPVAVALDSEQQTLRWQSIHPQIVVGTDFYDLHPTPLMTNRWEGLLQAPAGANVIHYRYKFDFQYNAWGKPKNDSALSETYTLRISEK